MTSRVSAMTAQSKNRLFKQALFSEQLTQPSRPTCHVPVLALQML
jgi:hypothetical protein